MSLAILFHFLCAQHVSDINISIIRSLRLCWWITTSVVLFSFRCVLAIWCDWIWVVPVLQAEALCFSLLLSGARVSGSSTVLQPAFEWCSCCRLKHCASACNTGTTQTQPHQITNTQTNWEEDDRCGNSTTQSQAPNDGYINVRNMLSTWEVK